MLSLDEAAEGTRRFLEEKWNAAVDVKSRNKIFGGASRETYRLELDVDGERRSVIVRRDPPSSLIDTERELEFGAYARIFTTDIPVPEPLFLETNPDYLGQPFSVMAAIEDCTNSVDGLSTEQLEKLGQQNYDILGRLAAMDPLALKFDELLPVPDPANCAMEQLKYWAAVISNDEIHPQPIAQAAIRWLRANPPAPAQKISIVHGDYKTGNFLFDSNCNITGVLDWEMCHLGDPYEDLAWAFDPLWSAQTPELAGRLMPHAKAIDIWQKASGLDFEETSFHWWRVFNAVKAIAIWISSSEDFESGESKDAILAYAGWVMTDRHNHILLDYLSPTGAAS